MTRWLPIWAVPIIIAMAIGTVWLRLNVVRTTYSINQTEQTIRQLQQEREQLELKFTALKSPRRLELLAKSRYGLSQPRAEQMIYIQRTPSSAGPER